MNEARATRPIPQSLRTIGLVLYVTLALLWLAVPQSVTNWTRDFLPYAAQPYAAPAAEGFEAFARSTGIPAVYDALRGAFQRTTGKLP